MRWHIRRKLSFLLLFGVDSLSSGKSVLMKVLCVEWLLRKNVKIGYICRNFLLAKKFFKDLCSILPSNLLKATNGTDLSFESIFGSTLTFYSAESGNSLRGLTFEYLICDEFAYFKMNLSDGSHLWNDILFPTIKAKGKKVIFVSTPFGKNNIFYDMYLRGLSNDYPNYASLKKTIYDDGFVTKEDIEDIKKSIPDLSFKQEFLCNFLDSSITFFSGFEKCFKDYDYSYNKTWIGIDLSADGQDETILTKINENNETEQFSINGTLDTKYKKIADIINSSNHLQYVYIEKNGIGVAMSNEIRKLLTHKSKLIEWLTTNSSKEEILSDLAVAISKEEIAFNNTNKELYSQLGTFISQHTKTGKLKLEAQSGKHDDCVMSLAISLACKNKTKSTSSISDYSSINISMDKYKMI